MRNWVIAVMVACAATGCSKRKLKWTGTRSPEVKLDGAVVALPAGWRDGAEAEDEDLHALIAKQPGAHGIVKEDFDGASMMIKIAPIAPTAAPACDDIAQTVAKREGATATSVQKLTLEGDPACQWIYKKDDLEGNYWMRFHDDHVLAITCFTQGDKGNLAACEQMRAGVKFVK